MLLPHSCQPQQSSDPASLATIEMHQNERHSLITVTDEAFVFFTQLDQTIYSLETKENMAIHGKELYTYIENEVSNDDNMKAQFNKLFEIDASHSETVFSKQIIEDLYREIIVRYRNMSAGQLRKEYVTQIKTEKEEAHRKQIRMTKTKADTVFNMKTILNDNTSNKIASHRRLQSEMAKSKDYLMSTFTVRDLKSLCKGYDVLCPARSRKAAIVEMLGNKILTCNQLPKPQLLQDCTEENLITVEPSVQLHEPQASTSTSYALSDREVEASSSVTEGFVEPETHLTMSTGTDLQEMQPDNALPYADHPPSPKRKKKPERKKKKVKWPCGV